MSVYSFRAVTVALVSALTIMGVTHAHAARFTVSLGAIYVQPQVDSPVLGAQVSSDTQPLVGLSYYFTRHIALATQIALPRSDISVDGVNQGRVSMAPFNLTAQYHFLPGRAFSPYVGAGINHTVFFNQGGNLSGFDRFGPSTGALVQAGFMYKLSGKYFLNLDVAKWYIKTDITPKGGSKIETMALNPVTVGLTIGRYF